MCLKGLLLRSAAARPAAARAAAARAAARIGFAERFDEGVPIGRAFKLAQCRSRWSYEDGGGFGGIRRDFEVLQVRASKIIDAKTETLASLSGFDDDSRGHLC